MFEFKSEGMTCKSCVRSITQAIQEVDPEARVTVDLREQKIQVQSRQSQKDIAAAIEEAGYPVLEGRTLAS